MASPILLTAEKTCNTTARSVVGERSPHIAPPVWRPDGLGAVSFPRPQQRAGVFVPLERGASTAASASSSLSLCPRICACRVVPAGDHGLSCDV